LNHKFYICPGSPAISTQHIELDESRLEDAIEDVFSEDAEDATLVWEAAKQPLSYKYDFPEITRDIIIMLGVLKTARGETKVHFRSSDFHTDWILRWNEDHLEVEEKSRMSLKSGYGYQGDLRKTVLSKSYFCSEWKKPLTNILKALKHSKLTHVSGFTLLERACSEV